MTQEEKDLLINDICARLQYGVKVAYLESVYDVEYIEPDYDEIKLQNVDYTVVIDEVKPYLRNMNSITEEELAELKEATCPNGTGTFNKEALLCPMSHWGEVIPYKFMDSIISWLDAHFFDHRGLIPLGLGIWVTEKNNPYKSEK